MRGLTLKVGKGGVTRTVEPLTRGETKLVFFFLTVLTLGLNLLLKQLGPKTIKVGGGNKQPQGGQPQNGNPNQNRDNRDRRDDRQQFNQNRPVVQLGR